MPLVGALLALGSAVVWGGGDFAGGLATRRGHPFQILLLSASSGVVMLGALAWWTREPMPDGTGLLYAAGAGAAGALGIAALYRGLAIASAATVAPVAAVVTALVPLVFASVTIGLPSAMQTAGFLLALAGIWIVAGASSFHPVGRTGVKLAVAAGIGFGLFLVLIAQVPRGSVFAPLAVARVVTLGVAVVLAISQRVARPSVLAHPLALLAGTLDAGGNVLYVLAGHYTRLDVAAVLSSLYPVSTVLLARVVDGQPVSRTQWVGAGMCLAAVALIGL